MSDDMTKVFTDIYENNSWGEECKSGPGSTLEANQNYIKIVENLIKAQGIQSVLDLGCGDWTFSQHINYNSVFYLGLDVVPSIIEENKKKFQKQYCDFRVFDFINNEIKGKCDLILIKDVLHHLSDQSIRKFIDNVLPKCKMALITNDWSRHIIKGDPKEMGFDFYRINAPIKDGESRPLNLAHFQIPRLPISYPRYSVQIKSAMVKIVKETSLWIRTE